MLLCQRRMRHNKREPQEGSLLSKASEELKRRDCAGQLADVWRQERARSAKRLTSEQRSSSPGCVVSLIVFQVTFAFCDSVALSKKKIKAKIFTGQYNCLKADPSLEEHISSLIAPNTIRPRFQLNSYPMEFSGNSIGMPFMEFNQVYS